MNKRILLLAVLTLNDFHLHLDSYLNIYSFDPTFVPFNWIYNHGYYFYNSFWAAYWGTGFLLALSLLLDRPRRS